jgi:hypothetical protein
VNIANVNSHFTVSSVFEAVPLLIKFLIHQ